MLPQLSSSFSSQYTYYNGTYDLQQQPPVSYIGATPPSVQLPAAMLPELSSSFSSQYTYYNGTYDLQQQPPVSYIGATPPSVQLPALTSIPGVLTLPQFQQAQQLFHRDAQTITPEALENVKAALASSESEHKAKAKKRGVPRKAAGKRWKDPTLAEWPSNDYRLWCGDLGNEVNDDVLSKAFSRFPTFNMAKDMGKATGLSSIPKFTADPPLVAREKWTGKTKGFGFVSFSNPLDLAAALKGMNGKYVGNRLIKLSKSKWQERNDNEAQKVTRNLKRQYEKYFSVSILENNTKWRSEKDLRLKKKIQVTIMMKEQNTPRIFFF